MANGRSWKPEHTDTLRRMNAVGYNDAEIAAITGHSRETVTRRRLCLGIACNQRQRIVLRREKLNELDRKIRKIEARLTSNGGVPPYVWLRQGNSVYIVSKKDLTF